MNLEDVWEFLESELHKHSPSIIVKKRNSEMIEFGGSIPAMQGKQKVEGYYFASMVKKPKDVRFFFFPIYTHKDDYTEISIELSKQLKGKSCFHLKSVDESIKKELSSFISKGIELYKKDHLI